MKDRIYAKGFGIIAFDGLSLAGKSTMVQMLHERSENTAVIRENTYDLIRPATSRLNKLFKQGLLLEPAFEVLCREYPQFRGLLEDAADYVGRLDFDDDGRKQASLAYLFTKGRVSVDEELMRKSAQQSIILDRWQVTGWAYQAAMPKSDLEPTELIKERDAHLEDWRYVKEMNDANSISYPTLQFLCICPLDQIPIRRGYRNKEGVGTAGQMSPGREDVIYRNFCSIYDWLNDNGIDSVWIENHGTPTPTLEDQIKQAVPAYLKVEERVRMAIENDASMKNYRLKGSMLTRSEGERYFLQDVVLSRIYDRQTKANVEKH